MKKVMQVTVAAEDAFDPSLVAAAIERGLAALQRPGRIHWGQGPAIDGYPRGSLIIKGLR